MTSNGFPYFQFHIDKWQAGKINAFDLEEQGFYLNLCILAWVNQGAFSVCSTTVQRRYRKTAQWIADTMDAFLEVGILERDSDKYRIKFIDDQVDLLTGKRQQRVDAGKASAAKRAAAAALLSSEPKTESKQEKRREEKSSTLNERSTTVELPLKTESIEEAFEVAWKAYPDKSGKTKALEAYRKYRKDGDSQSDIQDGIERYKAYVAAKRSGGQDLGWQNGKTFFGNAGWRDEWVCELMPPVAVTKPYANGVSTEPDAEWTRAYNATAEAIRTARATGDRGDISRAISTCRDKFRDCPKSSSGKDAVQCGVDLAMNERKK